MLLSSASAGEGRARVRLGTAAPSPGLACRLDPRAVAELAGNLIAELDHMTDLLIINRWGFGETQGQGFRSAIERAIELGIPVLLAVRHDYLANWLDFSGEFSTTLPLQVDAIFDWALNAVVESHGESDVVPEKVTTLR